MIDSDVARNALALMDASTGERVCFVGETIRDEYRFVAPLGKPAKENILAVEYLRTEAWAGGVAAARAHAASFCQADVRTNWAPVVKARYVDADGRKLFEAQTLAGVDPVDVAGLPECDTLAVCDFGHGMIDRTAAVLLGGRPEFLSIAVQTNAANAGFNLVTKYMLADYIVIDEPEARLAAHDRDSPIEDVMRGIAIRFTRGPRSPLVVVTHGRHGAYGGRLVPGDTSGSQTWEFLHQPAMSDQVVDTMGAGDAFFAVTAGMAQRAHEFGGMRTLLAIGCAAGAVKCGIMGHRAAVTREAVTELLGSACG